MTTSAHISALLLAGICVGCTSATGPDLSARITPGLLGTISIKNDDAFDWKNCRIDVNAHGFSSGWSVTQRLIPHGKKADLLLIQFADDDGTRFDPVRQVLKTVAVECDTPQGRSGYTGVRQ